MNNNGLSESDICGKFLRPAMEAAGWDGMTQIYREYPLHAGCIVVRGRQARRDASTVLRADYALFHKINVPIAVVEAKDNGHAMGAGMALAISSRDFLDVLLNLHKGVGALHVDVGDMQSASIPLAPRPEQLRIVVRVKELRGICAQPRERLSAHQAAQSRLARALVQSVTAA